MNRAAFGLIVALLPALVWGEESPGMPFLLLERSVRSAGLGGGGVALAGGGGGAATNPASIAFAPSTVLQVSLMDRRTSFPGLTRASLVYPDRKFRNSWALDGSYLLVKSDTYDEGGYPLPVSKDTMKTAAVTYAHRLGRGSAIGLTISYSKQALEPNSGTNLGDFEADAVFGRLGWMWRSNDDRFRLGAALDHLGQNVDFGSSSKAPLPRRVRAGIASRPLADERWLFTVDAEAGDYWASEAIRLGTEFALADRFVDRLGAAVRKRSDAFAAVVPAAGFSLSLGRLLIELAADLDPAGLGGALSSGLAWQFSGRPMESRPVADVGRRPKVAVLPIEAVGTMEAESAAVTEFLKNGLLDTDAFVLIERGNIEAVIEEIKVKYANCRTEACATDLGRLLEADKVIYGQLSGVRDRLYLGVNVVDIMNGRIEVSLSTDGTSVRRLRGKVRQLADEIADAYR